MPKVSVIIPAYNAERTLARCVGSVLVQDHRDLEVVIVEDGSTDHTEQVGRSLAERDERVRLVVHQENLGRHRARMSGMEAFSGDYALFLDADDELVDAAVVRRLLEEMERDPVSILRFGLETVGVGGIGDREAKDFQAWSNQALGRHGSRVMAELVFADPEGVTRPWNVTHRLFAGDLLREAVAHLSAERLERAEDAYEYLVIIRYAQSERDTAEIMGYRYFMGAGGTSGASLDPQEYRREVEMSLRSALAAQAFAEDAGTASTKRAARGLKERLAQHSADVMVLRTPRGDWEENATALAASFGNEDAALALWTLVRDRAQWRLHEGEPNNRGPELALLRRIAERLFDDVPAEAPHRLGELRAEALQLIGEFDELESRIAACDEDIRIFVTTDRCALFPPSTVLQPVQAGPSLAFARYPGCLHENEGQSIWEDYYRLGELTTQYWAWKNLRASYVGFCHYHRYFAFSQVDAETNAYGEVWEERLTPEVVDRYGLNDEAIRSVLADCDVLVPHPLSLPGVHLSPRSVRAWYRSCGFFRPGDLERIERICAELHPDYVGELRAVLAGTLIYPCNVYVLRGDLFAAYAAWLFPLLEEFVARANYVDRAPDERLAPAHLASILFTTWLLHTRREDATLRVRERALVRLDRPGRDD